MPHAPPGVIPARATEAVPLRAETIIPDLTQEAKWGVGHGHHQPVPPPMRLDSAIPTLYDS